MDGFWLRIKGPLFSLAYLSCLGALCVMGVQAYLHVPYNPLIIAVFMGLVFGIYLLNRTADINEDMVNDSSRIVFYLHRDAYTRLAVGVLVACLFTLVLSQKITWLHLMLLSIGAAYSFRFIPWLSGKEFAFARIKEILGMKNLSVAALWGYCVVAIPTAYAGQSLSNHPMLALMSFGLFLSTLNNTLFDDILDREGDQAAKIRTLPTVFGSRFSLGLLIALDLLWVAVIARMGSTGFIDGRHQVFLLVLAAYPAVYVSAHYFAPKRKGLVDALCEGDLLVFAAGLFLLAN